MTRVQKISTFAGAIGAIMGVGSLLQSPIKSAYNSAHDILTAMDTVRQIQGKQSEIQGFQEIIYKDQARIEKKLDTLNKRLELLNKGKYPFDSIMLMSRTNQRFKTTVKEELNK